MPDVEPLYLNLDQLECSEEAAHVKITDLNVMSRGQQVNVIDLLWKYCGDNYETLQPVERIRVNELDKRKTPIINLSARGRSLLDAVENWVPITPTMLENPCRATLQQLKQYNLAREYCVPLKRFKRGNSMFRSTDTCGKWKKTFNSGFRAEYVEDMPDGSKKATVHYGVILKIFKYMPLYDDLAPQYETDEGDVFAVVQYFNNQTEKRKGFVADSYLPRVSMPTVAAQGIYVIRASMIDPHNFFFLPATPHGCFYALSLDTHAQLL